MQTYDLGVAVVISNLLILTPILEKSDLAKMTVEENSSLVLMMQIYFFWMPIY